MIYLFLVGRIIFGGYFIKSGVKHFMHLSAMAGYAEAKGVPMPKQSVILTGLMMLLGGIGILLGVYTDIAIAFLVLFLIGTLFKMHTYWSIDDPAVRMGEHINFYKNLALIGALLMLLGIPMAWWAFPLQM